MSIVIWYDKEDGTSYNSDENENCWAIESPNHPIDDDDIDQRANPTLYVEAYGESIDKCLAITGLPKLPKNTQNFPQPWAGLIVSNWYFDIDFDKAPYKKLDK